MLKVRKARVAISQNRAQALTHHWTRQLAGAGVVVLALQAIGVHAQSTPSAPNPNIFIEQERRDAERAAQQRAQQERSTDVKLPTAITTFFA